MITYEQAMSIAQRHLDIVPLPSSDYQWRLSEPKESEDGWTFDYVCACLKDIPPDQREGFGGAPAFFVSKATGEVRVLGWDEVRDRSNFRANSRRPR